MIVASNVPGAEVSGFAELFKDVDIAMPTDDRFDSTPLIYADGYATRVAVEANVANEDIGFVREGQQVRAKLEAFPFTDYGMYRA